MPRPAGAFIRKRRQALDIEAKELAPRVGIEPGTLLNIENGHNTASTRLLHRIASELGVEYTELLDDPPTPMRRRKRAPRKKQTPSQKRLAS